MEIKIVPYGTKLKDGVFAFTQKCFEELGKKFEPEGRHGFYNDIGSSFVVFFCMLEGECVAGTYSGT